MSHLLYDCIVQKEARMCDDMRSIHIIEVTAL
jgi:hypothetical protein